MHIELTEKEFRRLLDMVYIGNWVLNSARGQDRFEDYDRLESKLFSLCRDHRMESLVEQWNGEPVPSRAFAEGGIHEAIMDYEDAVFFDILAEELARRDMNYAPISSQNQQNRADDVGQPMHAGHQPADDHECRKQNGTDRLQLED